ncbi:tetratricopeptide repeat protein [Olleya aquimaris]|nr:tetratricopeptide repeat protein [Olleya aquimaris]
MQEQDYILFEDYLSGDLSSKDQINFETRLNSDPEFKKAFTIYKDFSDYLDHDIKNESKTKDFKANLDNIAFQYFNKEKEIQSNQTSTKNFSFLKYAIAASVVILMGFFAYNQLTTQVGYSDYNTHQTIDFSVRSTTGNVDLLIKTTKAFNSKQFDKANLYLKQLLEENPDNTEYNFYYAITNIELDNFTVAETILNPMSQGNSAYKNRAKWYLALSKLKQDNTQECATILKTIPEDADDYSQAQRLLKKLE